MTSKLYFQGWLTFVEADKEWAGLCAAMATTLSKVKVDYHKSFKCFITPSFCWIARNQTLCMTNLWFLQLELQMGKLGSSDGCQLHHLLSFASACADSVEASWQQGLEKSRAGNLCTREYSVLRFFGFGAGFTSDHSCIVGIQCIQFVVGLKWKPYYK